MLCVALDTTTRLASCAVAREGVVLREEACDPDRQLALQLPGALDDLLALADVELRDVDAFAVATGPGSFTGLRIGISTMQGLAFAEEKPLIGISALTALRALAANAFLGSRIVTWVDAWRGDVYSELYVDGRSTGEPVVAKPDDLLAELARIPDPGSPIPANDVLFIGDGAETYRDLISAKLGPAARIADPATPLLAGMIATLATIQYTKGILPPPHAIRPIYVRRSDAELARERGPGRSAPHNRTPDPGSRIPPS